MQLKNMEQVYLIKNVSPWMLDELIVFAKNTKFKLIFLRKPSDFYVNQLDQLRTYGIEIRYRPFNFKADLKKIFFCIKFTLKNYDSFFSGYSFVISLKSIVWFALLDDIFFQQPVSIHAQFATQSSILALMLSKYYGNNHVKYFFTFHAYDIFFNNKWFVKLVNNSENSFSISQYNIEYVLRKYKGLDASKFQLCRLGAFPNSSPQFKKTSPESFNIGFISWLVKKKGLKYLLMAMKSIARENSNIKLIIAGDGPLREEVESYISKNNLSSSVQFVGRLDYHEKSQFFLNLDILVLPAVKLPNDMEGIPVVLMEAISYGLPIIASDISGIPEICINNYNGILVPEKNVPALVKAIMQTYRDKIARRKFANNSIKLFEKYNIETNSLTKLAKLNWS